ncbi:MAG: hypothetical protein V1850_04980 [Candidatus Bathyarchaeota archaeon]
MSEFTAWSKLPVDLQHQFFSHAEEESKKCTFKQTITQRLVSPSQWTW